VLAALGAAVEDGASDELDASGLLVLATRDGLRCIFPSRILFCCTRKGMIVGKKKKKTPLDF